jgi:hypothetical protein
LEKRNKLLQSELHATKKAINEKDIMFFSLQQERDSYKLNYDMAKFLLSDNGIELLNKDGIAETQQNLSMVDYSNGI